MLRLKCKIYNANDGSPHKNFSLDESFCYIIKVFDDNLRYGQYLKQAFRKLLRWGKLFLK